MNADGEVRPDAAGTDEVEPCAAALGGEIRRRRKLAGLSHAQLAARVGYSRQYVSIAERPGKGVPSADLVRALDTELVADGALVGLHARATAARRARRPRPETGRGSDASVHPGRADVTSPNQLPAAHPALTEPAHSMSLIAVLGPDGTLDVLDEFTVSVIARYELEGPRLLAPEPESTGECGLLVVS